MPVYLTPDGTKTDLFFQKDKNLLNYSYLLYFIIPYKPFSVKSIQGSAKRRNKQKNFTFSRFTEKCLFITCFSFKIL